MESCAVEERMKFVLAVEVGEESFSHVCRCFEISRRVGYKWLERYRLEGMAGLLDRSRRPGHCPHAVSEDVVERCLAVRRRHPTWGPRKVLAWLSIDDPVMAWPAASTIGEMFDRAGLTVRRRRRLRVPAYSAPFASCCLANDVWTIDFKGWFRTADGRRCDPLTLQDACTRYLLRCQVLAQLDYGRVWPVLEAAFREYGLPVALRSDNGTPFASRAAGGLSKLAVRVIQAGVVPERIAPGHPEQNGRHERLHRTLKEDTASPPAASLRAQAVRFRRFQRIYNEERPHEALDQTPPGWHYQVSPRSWDGVLRSPQPDQAVAKRRVGKDGMIKWCDRLVYINENLAGEWLGLEEVAEGLFDVRYGPVSVGRLRHRGKKLIRKAAGRGLVDNAEALPTTPPPQPPQGDENEE
jgi:transposase InsO family protein